MTPEQTSDMLQKLLEQSQANLACAPGTTCQQGKQEQAWQTKLQQAKENAESAPIILQQTEEEYYTFLGQKGEDIQRTKYEKEAQTQTEKIKVLLQTLMTQTQNQQQTTQVAEDSYHINQQLLADLQDKQIKLTKKEIQNQGDIFTNQRRAYYTNQSLSRLQTWGLVLWIIYYLIWIWVSLFTPINWKPKVVLATLPLIVYAIDYRLTK